jgi:DNA-binding MarR family transcriptional regulator
MQVPIGQCRQFIRSISPSGNLFLLATLQELRFQGLTYIAFYALQRIVRERELFESSLRQETGLEDYEVSRACKFLESSGMIEIKPYEQDKRVRVLSRTKLGVKIHDQVVLAAAKRLQKRINSLKGFDAVGEDRRLVQATEAFQKSNQILFGSLQLSFFETSPEVMGVTQPRTAANGDGSRSHIGRKQKP